MSALQLQLVQYHPFSIWQASGMLEDCQPEDGQSHSRLVTRQQANHDFLQGSKAQCHTAVRGYAVRQSDGAMSSEAPAAMPIVHNHCLPVAHMLDIHVLDC